MKPIGIGMASVESATSYVSRVAQAHCLPVRKLVTHEILPLFGRAYLVEEQENNNLSAFWKDASALNGVSNSTLDWIGVLETLTLFNNLRYLTMLTWEAVLSPRYLIRRTRAWCPLCYEEWYQNGVEVYEPLLWSLEVVAVCRYHNRHLEVRCPSPKCKRTSSVLSAQMRSGYCPHCGQWLGEVPKQGLERRLTYDEYQWQYWVAETVSELLAAAPSLSTLPRRERFAEAIATYLEDFDGNVSALARKLRVSRRTIRDWRQGLQIPQLDSLLRLCYLVETTPLHLFALEAMRADTAKPSVSTEIEIKGKIKTQHRILEAEKIKKELESELLLERGSPLPMCAVAKHLNYDHSFLCKHFPDLCRVISARYQAYRKKQREERKQRILDEVREAAYRVHKEGLYPSQERVRLRLAKPGSIREPGALAVWHQTLGELGLESSSP